jgi:hypothetical protein
MDDRNAFERQIAAEIDYEVGPPHPVDALAITRLAKTPTPRWRIRSMFSPAKAITAAALVVGVGSVLLIAQPFSQRASAPGAATDAAPQPPTEFTGIWCIGPAVSVEGNGTSTAVKVADELSVNRYRGGTWRNAVVMSDPRLQGDAYQTYEQDTYTSGPSVIASTLSIVNDDGAWVATYYRATADGSEPGDTDDLFIGEGAYEGLVALMGPGTPVRTPEGLPIGYSDCQESSGVIFDQPPVPVPYLGE